MKLWTPHKNQEKILKDNKRFKVIVCGRRFGKTTYAINYLIEEALINKGTQYFYIAPTYRQAKMIAWDMLVRSFNMLPKELQGKLNESELYCTVGNGSRIDIKGADNPDALRGVGLDGAVLDEYADMKKNVFGEIIEPALLDKAGWCHFIGTPRGFNHFHELYTWAQDEEDYSTYHFTSYDNPLLPSKEIDRIRRKVSDDTFAQEYLADFRKHEGLIYKDFDRATHVIDPFVIPVGWLRYGAMDFGATNPTVHLWIAVDKDENIYVYDEYYQRERTVESHANVIKTKTNNMPMSAVWGDPAGTQEMMDYASHGIYVSPAVKIHTGEKGWVRAGIDRITSLLKLSPVTGKPKIFIFKTCKEVIREMERYQWTEQSVQAKDELNEKDVPLKANDHAMDALRYFVVSYYASKPITDPTII